MKTVFVTGAFKGWVTGQLKSMGMIIVLIIGMKNPNSPIPNRSFAQH